MVRVQITATQRQISQINPREQFLEPIGGSHNIGALRSYNARFNSLKIEAASRANKISNGHGFAKHEFARSFRQTTDHTRFTNITTREQYAARIYDTIVNGTHSRALGKGRTVYYKVKTRMIVVVDPNSRDSGTAYPAFDGIRTYNAIKK